MDAHRTLTKNATDVALQNWKQGTWPNDVISPEVYQTIAAQQFPSPDSMLYDPTNKHKIAFEFKPPTESKRGILTGIGQAIAYLSLSSASFLVTPKEIEGYNLSDYLSNLFSRTIHGKLPVGLICYSDEEAKEIDLTVDIDPTISLEESSSSGSVGRYWAKHVDMPLHALWTLLNIAYLMPDKPARMEAIWRKFWDAFLFPKKQRDELEVSPSKIAKHDGTPLYILQRVKNKLRREVDNGSISMEAALQIIREKTNPSGPGDNYYKSYRKNFLPLIKHIMLWDDNGHLLEDGYRLHKAGKIHGPTSKTFRNLFGRLLLFNGKHLELILDVEKHTRNRRFSSSEAAVKHIQSIYIKNGLYKPSPGKTTTGTAQFLKYERIIWGHLGLLKKINNTQFIPKKGFIFDWDQITELCSFEP